MSHDILLHFIMSAPAHVPGVEYIQITYLSHFNSFVSGLGSVGMPTECKISSANK